MTPPACESTLFSWKRTGYYDWLYCAARVVSAWSQAAGCSSGFGVNIFLKMGASGLRTDDVFDARDTLAGGSDLKLDHTATSNLRAGAIRALIWDTRSAIRMQV